MGFEPTKVSLAGFQDRCTRPLCEPSVDKLTRNRGGAKIYGLIIREVVVTAQLPLPHHLLRVDRFETLHTSLSLGVHLP